MSVVFIFVVIIFVGVVGVVKLHVILHSCNPSRVEENKITTIGDLEAFRHLIELGEAMHHSDDAWSEYHLG
jgi:hypothetical protein